MSACTVPGCPVLDPVVEVGAYACDRCLGELVHMLGEIETYLELLARLAPVRMVRPTERRSTGYASASPADDTIIAMLDRRSTINGGMFDTEPEDEPDQTAPAIGVLASWCGNVVEQLQPDPVRLPPGPVGDTRRLRLCAGALVRQPWIGDLLAEITTVHVQLRTAVGDVPPNPIAACIDTSTGQPCHAPVFWVISARDQARCSRCHKTYAGLELVELRLAQEKC